MKHRRFISSFTIIALSLSLAACGKKAVELDMSAKAEYIQKVSDQTKSSDGRYVLTASDDGVKEYGAENVFIEMLSKDYFLEAMPEGAEYYADLIRNRLTLQYAYNGLALIHFDEDELPELMVIDGDLQYGDGKIYSIGSDGRPYLMLKFISNYGGVSYQPYRGIYSMTTGSQGWFMTFFLKYEGNGVKMLQAMLSDESGLPYTEDNTPAPPRYYIDVPVSEGLKKSFSDPLNVSDILYRVDGASSSDLELDRATEVEAGEYKGNLRKYDGSGFVSVGAK